MAIVVHSKHVLDYENIEGGLPEFDRVASLLYDWAPDFFQNNLVIEAGREGFERALKVAREDGDDDVAKTMQSILDKADPNCPTVYVEFWQ